MNKEEWVEIAEKRIRNTLRVRGIASKRQLEMKISEAGPPSMRANPHHISKALEALIKSGEVVSAHRVSTGVGQPTPLYSFSDWDSTSPTNSARLQRVNTAYEEFLRIAQNEDNGESFQNIVQQAIEGAGQYAWFNEPGKPPPNGSTISGQSITGSGDLDHYLLSLSPSAIRIGVEDKSYREWIYPNRQAIKAMLRKCRAYKMLPVLIARKVHYTTRLFFHYLGAVAFETHFQYFSPKYETRLADAKHKDGLGFADIRFSEEPPQHVVNLFSTLLPQLATASWEKFQSNQELIAAYLDDELDYYHLIGELGIVELEEDEYYEHDETNFHDFELD